MCSDNSLANFRPSDLKWPCNWATRSTITPQLPECRISSAASEVCAMAVGMTNSAVVIWDIERNLSAFDTAPERHHVRRALDHAEAVAAVVVQAVRSLERELHAPVADLDPAGTSQAVLKRHRGLERWVPPPRHLHLVAAPAHSNSSVCFRWAGAATWWRCRGGGPQRSRPRWRLSTAWLVPAGSRSATGACSSRSRLRTAWTTTAATASA